MQKHWIIRVNDGKNFKNSTLPFWGVKSGNNGSIKTVVSKINKGDVLWFLTSKKYGSKMIGMAEYSNFTEIKPEEITKNNEEQKWEGNEAWNLQLHYCKLINTEEYMIHACIQCCGTILEYDTFKTSVTKDLYEEYKLHSKPTECIDDIEKQMLDLLKNKLKVKHDICAEYASKISNFPTLKDQYIKLQESEINIATEHLSKQIQILSQKINL